MGLLGGGFQLGGTGSTGAPAPSSPAAPFTPGDPLGVDVSCYPDLDPLGTLVSGKTALAQALARRLTTRRGSLFYDTNYGLDVRLYLSEAMTAESVSRLQAEISSECKKDERVSACTVTVTFNAAAFTLQISISISTASGPFALTLNVSRLTVDLLTVT